MTERVHAARNSRKHPLSHGLRRASSPKGTPYGNAENFVAATKSRPLGQTLPGRGEMSRQRQSGERVASPQAMTEGVLPGAQAAYANLFPRFRQALYLSAPGNVLYYKNKKSVRFLRPAQKALRTTR